MDVAIKLGIWCYSDFRMHKGYNGPRLFNKEIERLSATFALMYISNQECVKYIRKTMALMWRVQPCLHTGSLYCSACLFIIMIKISYSLAEATPKPTTTRNHPIPVRIMKGRISCGRESTSNVARR